MILKDIKAYLLSVFRQAFVYHHSSLEIRAKLYAAIIVAKGYVNKEDYENLKKIGISVYSQDEKRANVLVHTTKEYIDKILANNNLNLDELLMDIDKNLQKNKRFVEKVNLLCIEKFILKDDEDNKNITQLRVFEFLENQIKSSLT